MLSLVKKLVKRLHLKSFLSTLSLINSSKKGGFLNILPLLITYSTNLLHLYNYYYLNFSIDCFYSDIFQSKYHPESSSIYESYHFEIR